MPPLVSGIVLAGGRSTRFGSDKLAASYGGQPLLLRPIAVFSELCDDVIVVRRPGESGEGLPSGVRVANDPTEGEGPLAGLHAGLMAAVRSDLAVIAGGDMPELQTVVLRAMLGLLDDAAVDAVLLADGARPRPLPAAVRTWPAADMTHALLHGGRRRLRDLFDSIRTAVIDESTWTALDPERRTVIDVDEPADMPE
jgi:molybdenum cofactor guanylyltransferase